MPVLTRKAPPTLPGYLVFNPKEIKQDPLGFYSRVWKEFGDLAQLRVMPNYSIYAATHPSYAEHILSTHQEIYGKPDISNKPFNLLMGESILTSEGDSWFAQRRLMQPAFHLKYLANLATVMVSCTESFLQEWENKDGEVIDIAAETLRLTLKIAGLTLFSSRYYE